MILDPEQGTFTVRQVYFSNNLLWVVGVDDEEEDRIENVIGRQNKIRLRNTLYHVTSSKVKLRKWNLLKEIP